MKSMRIFLGAFLISLSLTPMAWAEGGVCANVFEVAPSRFQVDLSDKKADDFLEQAFHNLLKKGQLEDSRHLLKKISEKGSDSLSAEEIATLKNTRKHTAILRSTLQIASEDHASPSPFAEFVKDFGHLNDMIASQKSAEARDLARDVLKDYKKVDYEEMQKKIDSASRKSMRNYFESLHEEADGLMGQKKVSLEEYHEVRKILKEFLSFYQLSDQVYGPNLYTAEYKYLYELNEKLGNLNDRFTAEVIDGAADKQKTKIIFPDELRHDVEYFLSHCEMTSKAH